MLVVHPEPRAEGATRVHRARWAGCPARTGQPELKAIRRDLACAGNAEVPQGPDREPAAGHPPVPARSGSTRQIRVLTSQTGLSAGQVI